MDEAELMQRLLDSSGAIIYLKDDHGRILLVNRGFLDFFKKSKDQIIGKTDHALGTDEQVKAWRANDLKATESGKPYSFEETASGAEGTRTFMSYKFPVHGIEGAPKAVGGISVPLTN
jgi:PAS domain S-box-containing protein